MSAPPLLPAPEPDVDPDFRVLFENERLAVVAKSGNLPCHPGGRYRRNTLEALLLGRAGFPAVHVVGRLDRETSGAVLVAKDPATAGALGRDAMARRIRKTYLCIVRGAFPAAPGPDGWTDVFGRVLPAGDEVVHRYRVFVRETDEAAWRGADPATAARTRFRVLRWEDFGVPGSPGFSLLECETVTGRTHQIRATLRGLGLEVAGDKLYGPDRAIYGRLCEGRLSEDDRRALGMPRQALHCWRIGFRDPATGEPHLVEAPPDALLDEFRAAFLPAAPAPGPSGN